jgi:UDP-glucose 4-epimerase
MNVLLTGGAGYIGSTTANLLLDQSHTVTIIDNLSTGNEKNIPKKATFIKSDISNKLILSKLFKKNKFDVIIHFAAFIDVEESVRKPKKYIKNNYLKTKKFLEVCKLYNQLKIIFSSTAAVYGDSKLGIISENAKLKPISPYAISKLNSENYIKNNNINYVILRYFNVAGADTRMRSGLVSKKKSTHLIKKICESFFSKKKIQIYGNDYPSLDGTAIRDYIHVADLALAHIQAAKYLIKKNISITLNCGYGKGYSVKNVIDTFNKICGDKVQYIYTKRRAGDLFKLVANISLLKKKLKWKPKNNSLKKILESSLKWEKRLNRDD